MNTSRIQIFTRMPDTEQSERMSATIMAKIDHSRTIRARIYGSIHGVLLVCAIIAAVPAIQYLSAEATLSGFTSYASLVASDGTYIAADWRDFILSLAESLPILGSAIVIGIALVFANSLRKSVRYLSDLRSHTAHAAHTTAHIAHAL